MQKDCRNKQQAPCGFERDGVRTRHLSAVHESLHDERRNAKWFRLAAVNELASMRSMLWCYGSVSWRAICRCRVACSKAEVQRV